MEVQHRRVGSRKVDILLTSNRTRPAKDSINDKGSENAARGSVDFCLSLEPAFSRRSMQMGPRKSEGPRASTRWEKSLDSRHVVSGMLEKEEGFEKRDRRTWSSCEREGEEPSR